MRLNRVTKRHFFTHECDIRLLLIELKNEPCPHTIDFKELQTSLSSLQDSIGCFNATLMAAESAPPANHAQEKAAGLEDTGGNLATHLRTPTPSAPLSVQPVRKLDDKNIVGFGIDEPLKRPAKSKVSNVLKIVPRLSPHEVERRPFPELPAKNGRTPK